MGGDKEIPKLNVSREQAQAIYQGGPDAVYSFMLHTQDLFHNLVDRVNRQVRLQQEQTRIIAQQEARIRELEAIINKDSHNSSKPPSSDGLRKIPKTRKKSGKKPGGQKGHPGHTLCRTDTPDKIEVHQIAKCQHCGASLRSRAVEDYERRQVFDIPPIKVEVTEHRAEVKTCNCCGSSSRAAFPEDVAHIVQYGPQIKATAVYIKNYGLLPYARAAGLFADLFGVPLSAGTLVRIDREAGERLAEVNERIRTGLLDAAIVHFDETGMRIGGRLHWLHVASTPLLTMYLPHAKRGGSAIDAMGILPDYQGRAIHDGWQSYFNYCCDHGLCNAHHLRELTFLAEVAGQSWAQQMIDLLVEIKQRRDRSRGTRFSTQTIDAYEQRYEDILKRGQEANPPPAETGPKKRGRKKKTPAANLIERLRLHSNAVLAFMYDFSVPFDNNQAERDIRMMKVQQKISGTFRSTHGPLSFCKIRSYISTVKKHGMNVIAALQDVFLNRSLLPQVCIEG